MLAASRAADGKTAGFYPFVTFFITLVSYNDGRFVSRQKSPRQTLAVFVQNSVSVLH